MERTGPWGSGKCWLPHTQGGAIRRPARLPWRGQGQPPWRVRLQHLLRVTATHTLMPPVGFCGLFGDTQALRKRPLGACWGPAPAAGPAPVSCRGFWGFRAEELLPCPQSQGPHGSSASGRGASQTPETQAELSRWFPGPSNSASTHRLPSWGRPPREGPGSTSLGAAFGWNLTPEGVSSHRSRA